MHTAILEPVATTLESVVRAIFGSSISDILLFLLIPYIIAQPSKKTMQQE